MQRKFLTNLLLLLFLNLLVKPFWILGIDRTVQNTVGEEAYGLYFFILNFSFLFNILLDMGITNFNNRNIAQHKHLLNKHFSGILIIKLLLASFYFLVTFSVALIIGYGGQQLYLLAWVALNQFLLSFILYLRSNISGLLMFRTDSFLSVLDRLLMILFCSILLWGHVTEAPFRIEWFVYAQTLAYLITFLIAFGIVVKRAAFRRLNWNTAFFIMILKQSFPYAMLILLMTMYYRSDSVFIERLLKGTVGYQQSGVYAKAFRLLDAANMIPLLFSVLLLPLFSRMIKTNQSIVPILKLSFSLLFTLSVSVAIGSAFYRYELMELLYVGDSRLAPLVFGKIMFSFVAMSSIYIFGSLLTANGNLKQLNMISLVALLVNFTINIILVPKYMAIGSAYANLATQFTAAIPQIWLAIRVFNLKWNGRYILSLAGFIAGILVINIVSRQLPYSWLINFCIMVVFSVVLSVALKLLDFKGLAKIVREKD
ncbi:MAG: oligosaccharide flippase family protein [Bacteroidales bacterium]